MNGERRVDGLSTDDMIVLIELPELCTGGSRRKSYRVHVVEERRNGNKLHLTLGLENDLDITRNIRTL